MVGPQGKARDMPRRWDTEQFAARNVAMMMTAWKEAVAEETSEHFTRP